MPQEPRDVTFADLFRGLDPSKLKIDNPIQVPDDLYRELLDSSMERSTLEYIGQRRHFPQVAPLDGKITWLQVTRLPVHPDNMDSYDLYNRWQGVLSSLHAWGYRFLFLLQRREGQTHLYLGTVSTNRNFVSQDAIEQMREATSGSMPGVELRPLDNREIMMDILNPMLSCQSMGAVTGLPSFFGEKEPGVLQTLDSLAFGIRGCHNEDRPYSLLVIADPISDRETGDIINRMRQLGSQIHSDVERSVNANQSKSESKQKGLNPYTASKVTTGATSVLSSVLGGAGTARGTVLGGGLGASIGKALGGGAAVLLGSTMGIGIGQLSKTVSESYSLSVNTTYLDKFAQYAEELTQLHIERMKQGPTGMWASTSWASPART